MPIIDFSPEFELEYYRDVYPEMKILPDEVLMEHYKRFAV